MKAEKVEKLGIRGLTPKKTERLFRKLLRWGWIDVTGRQLTWREARREAR